MNIDDRLSVNTNPSKLTGRAKARYLEAEARKRRPIDDAGDKAFRAICPGCSAPNVIMSEVSMQHVKVYAPMKGDVIDCDRCGTNHVVTQVNGQTVKTVSLELDLTDVELR